MRLCVEGLHVTAGPTPVASNLTFTLDAGDVIVLEGPADHRTRVLRALAGLDPVRGRLTLDRRDPQAWGWPAWRSQVTYVPRRVPELPGSPRALHRALSQLGHGTLSDAPSALVKSWGMSASRLSDPWHQLDPGEAQRALLSLIIARDPAVLLLDQPTADLKGATSRAVEASLLTRTAVWAPTDEDQRERLIAGGARTLALHPRA